MHDSTQSTRLNKAPIFVNGFGRGGSNILINLLLSHPEVCSPSGETQKVFRGGSSIESLVRSIYKRVFYNIPITAMSGRAVFKLSNLESRPLWSPRAARFIDSVLYREKLRARHERYNCFIREGVRYSHEQILRSRLLCKNLNGLILTTKNFAAMYPDATFFGLIRNGLAVCEGNIRRGRSAEAFGKMYERLASKMIEFSENMDNFHIVRFEKILLDPIEQMKVIYQQANLDFARIDMVRLQIKPTLSKTGQHELKYGYDRQVVWLAPDKVQTHFDPEIDAIQIANLSRRDREIFLKNCGKTMEKLGYL